MLITIFTNTRVWHAHSIVSLNSSRTAIEYYVFMNLSSELRKQQNKHLAYIRSLCETKISLNKKCSIRSEPFLAELKITSLRLLAATFSTGWSLTSGTGADL